LKYKPLPTPEELKKMNAVLIDTRDPKVFEQGYIPGSINLPLSMNYAMWIGTLFDANTQFFIIADKHKEGESIVRLSRIGYDKVIGVLKGGIEDYMSSGKPLETIKHVAPTDLTPDMTIFDVRNPGEV
jgi:hydroxyacylglutathione hydrolase